MEEESLLPDLSRYSTIFSTVLVIISLIIVLIILVMVGTCCHVCCGCNENIVDGNSTWITESRCNNRLVRRKTHKRKTPPFDMQCIKEKLTSDVEKNILHI